MAFTLYTSDDAGAPVLDGLAGSLQSLLYACLVTGYGAKPAAGWSRAWLAASGNSAVFKPADAQDAFYYLHDNAPGAHGGREARVHMGLTHDGDGTLSITAPQNYGYPNGHFIRKSAAATSLTRNWYMYADAKTAYLFIETGDSNAGFVCYAIGKAIPVSPLEAFPWLLAARSIEGSTSASYIYHAIGQWIDGGTTVRQLATPVNADGSATSAALIPGTVAALRGGDSNGLWGSSGPGAPGPYTGILPLWDGLLCHQKEPRLRLRGLSSAYVNATMTEPDTFSATVNGVLRTFTVRKISLTGTALIETSDTLDL